MGDLGLHAGVEEGPVLLFLLWSHHLSHSSFCLIVVQELDERAVGRPPQDLLFHPREQRVLRLVSTLVCLCTCTHPDSLSLTSRLKVQNNLWWEIFPWILVGGNGFYIVRFSLEGSLQSDCVAHIYTLVHYCCHYVAEQVGHAMWYFKRIL